MQLQHLDSHVDFLFSIVQLKTCPKNVQNEWERPVSKSLFNRVTGSRPATSWLKCLPMSFAITFPVQYFCR